MRSPTEGRDKELQAAGYASKGSWDDHTQLFRYPWRCSRNHHEHRGRTPGAHAAATAEASRNLL